MSLEVTVAIAAVALILGALCAWRGSKPAPLLGAPRMVPWRFLMLACFTGVVVALVHIVQLVHPS